MHRHRILPLLGLLVLLLSALPAAVLAAPAAQEAQGKIEAYLLDQFALEGTWDYGVVFGEQADLSAAASLGWSERGWYVYNALKETAARSQGRAVAMARDLGLRYESYYAGNELYIYDGTLSTANAFAALPEVARVYGAKTYYLDPTLSQARAVPQGPDALAWGIDWVEADLFWGAFGMQGDGILVANIDTGVQWDHPALDQAYKCPGNPTDASCWLDPSNACGGVVCDNNGHGTHTMGTMVADDDPSLTWQAGMAPDAQFIMCKGCESSSCSTTALNACGDWVVAPGGNPDNRPNVVNNSWGGRTGTCDTWYLAKVQAWVAAGIFPAFSAGNSGSSCSTLGVPGVYQESFASAGFDSAGNTYTSSSRGPAPSTAPCDPHTPYTKPNIAAPAVSVCSTIPGNSWSCGYTGTSMASPHTAGAVALLWSCNPSLIGQIDQTFNILQDNADTPPTAGNCGVPPDNQGDYTHGYGYLDVYNAGLLWCGDTGYLAGQVTDAATGSPVEGALVDAGGPNATTDATGHYTITLMAGTYDVTASHPHYESLTVAGVVVATGTVTTQDFSLQPRGLLWGYVTDFDNGFPLEGATVTAEDGTTDDTDAAGYYEMYLDEGTYVVTATAQDYAPEWATVAVISGTGTQEDFALQAAVVFVPAPLRVTVDWQATQNTVATLTNRLPADYAFTFMEQPGGVLPGLVLGEAVPNEPRGDADVAPTSRPAAGPLAVGDPLFSIALDGATGDNQNLGVEWAGGFWWVTGGAGGVDPNKLYKLDVTGALVGTYNQPAGCTSWGGRDMAYDGTYLYYGCDDGSIYQVDPATGAATGVTIPDPVTPARALAYDPATDHFFTANFSGSVYEIDRAGTIVHQWSNTLIGKYGMAWDRWSATGPYLWIWSQDPNVLATQYYFDGTNLTPTGVSFAGVNPTVDLAGGATAVSDHPDYPGQLLLAGLHQATPDAIWAYDLDVLVTPPDVPWFGQAPVAGTVPAQGSIHPTMYFTATSAVGVDQPGDYWCDLKVLGDPQLTVRVTMTVLPGDLGQLHGTVLDNCTGEPVEADVYIPAGQPITQTTSDPATGYYSVWLYSGTYAITFTAGGYLPYGTVVDVPEDGAVVLDVSLVPDRACIAVDPASFEVWVLTGTQELRAQALENGGGADLAFEYREQAGGYVTATALLNPIVPIEGTTGPVVAWHESDNPPADWFSDAPPAPIAGIEAWGLGTAIPSGAQFGNPMATTDNANFYLMGGLTAGGVYLNQTLYYDTASGVWTTMANMPTARNNTHAFYDSDGGKIYVPGGYLSGSYITNFDAYDPASNTWQALAPLPEGKVGVQGGVVDGKVYVLGGNNNPTTTYIYDIASNSWSTGAPLPVGNYYGSEALYEGKIYVIGGWGSTNFLRYDPATNSWEVGPSLPVARNSPAAVVSADGRLYIWGGGNSWTPYYDGLYYDLANWPGGSWTTIAGDNMPYQNIRSGYACAGTQMWDAGGGPQSSAHAYNQNWSPTGGSLQCYWPSGAEDVPWVWEDPVTGTVAPQDTGTVEIGFTSYYTAVPTGTVVHLPLGTYTATLLIQNNDTVAGRQVIPVTMHIVDQFISPTASFLHNAPVCLGNVVVFTNTTTPGVPADTDYLWDFGDGSTSTLEDPTHFYGLDGVYTVTLTACNTAGCTTAQDLVTVDPLPGAQFSYVVAERTVTFTDQSTDATAWLWEFGDGITDTVQNPVHTYAVAGPYIVTLHAYNGCGEGTMLAEVTVGDAPIAAFTHTAPVCLGEAVTFANGTVGTEPIAYFWTFGDGGTSTETNPVYDYLAAGIYTVTLDASNDFGASQAAAAVEIQETAAGFTYTVNGQTVTFVSTAVGATAYLWDFGDGFTDTVANPVHTYAGAGLYDVSLAVTGVCGTDTATMQVMVTGQTYTIYLPVIYRITAP